MLFNAPEGGPGAFNRAYKRTPPVTGEWGEIDVSVAIGIPGVIRKCLGCVVLFKRYLVFVY